MLRVIEEEESNEKALSRKRSKRNVIAEENTDDKPSKDRIANNQADSERVAQSLLDAAEKESDDKKLKTGATKALDSATKNLALSTKFASKRSSDTESNDDSTKKDLGRTFVTASDNSRLYAESNTQKPSLATENLNSK